MGADVRLALSAENMDVSFGLTHAVNQVSLAIPTGAVLGVIGPNGAGKSTLMRLIAGELKPDRGSMAMGGELIDMARYSPSVAHAAGLRTVHQELSLCLNLKVFENFIIETGQQGGRHLQRRMRESARVALDYAFPASGIDVDAEVGTLSLAQQQMVEISRAVSADNLKVLILDEPTSALPANRVEQLRVLLDLLRDRGVASILITHRLKEVMDLTESLIVMKDGVVAHHCRTADVDADRLVTIMGGNQAHHSLVFAQRTGAAAQAAPVLEITHLSQGLLRDINLHAQPGELVGVYGLEGSGQKELLRAIFATKPLADGPIRVPGSSAFVSGDRKREGLFALWPLGLNLSLSSLGKLSSAGVINSSAERKFIGQWLDRLCVKVAGPDDPITALSGGNQQKIIIARALATDAPLVILDDPTRGVDPRTKADVYELLHTAAARGCTALFYSTEEQELLECDRVYVMSGGAIVEELVGRQITRESLVAAAFKGQEAADVGEGNTAAVSSATVSPASMRASYLHRVSRGRRWLLPAVVLVVMAVILQILNHDVLSKMGLGLLIGAAIPLVLAALGQMFIIGLGDIDLGMGAFIGFVNAITVTVLTDRPLLGCAALIAGIALYGVVGALVHVRRLPAIVATLGMSFVWLGLGLTVLPTVGGVAPDWLLSVYSYDLPFVPLPLVLVALLAVLAWWVTTRTRFGILVRGFGNNPVALETAGWSRLGIRVAAFAVAGVSGVLAGLALTAVTTSGDPSSAQSYTLLAITSVVVGGSELMGGVIEAVGAVLGAVILSLVGVLLSLLGVDPNYTAAVTGLILIVVLASRGYARRVRVA